jgi:PST family polysaccharide transporter
MNAAGSDGSSTRDALSSAYWSDHTRLTDMTSRNLTQRTASGVAWITAFQVSRQVLQVISVSVLARRVPPAAYGLIAMAVLVTSLLETIRDAGTGQALIREREMSDEIASTVFWLNVLLGGAVTLLVVLASYPAARFFHEPQITRVLQVLSISFFLGAMSVVPTALLNRAMEFRKLAVAQTAGAVCGTIVAITVALAGGKVWSLVAGTLFTVFTTTIAVWIYAPVHIKFVFLRDPARRILSFGLNLSGFHIFNYFSRNADNLLVGKFLGSVALGYYQMGYMLMTYPLQNFTLMVAQVVYPAMAKFHEDHARVRAAYLRTSALVALVTLPIMLGMGVTAPSFVRVFLGPRWAPVAALLAVFAPLGAMQSIYATVGVIYNIQGRTDLQFRWMMFASVWYVMSFIVGLRWGILGVATSYAIVWTLLMVPSFLIPFRLIQLSGKSFLRTLWPTIWMSLAMAACAGAWTLTLHRFGIVNPFVDLLTTVLVGITVYVGLVLMYKPPVLAELATVLEGTSYRAVQSIGRRLPRGRANVATVDELSAPVATRE